MRLPPLGALTIAFAAIGCGAPKPAASPIDRTSEATAQTVANGNDSAVQTNTKPIPIRLPCAPDDAVGCEKACSEDIVEDCVTLGVMYLDGKSVEPNQERAIDLFRASCSRNSARGCLKLGDLYHDGRLTDDPTEEAAFYRKACDLGANQGCVAAGKAYLEGRIVGADPAFASTLFARVCERGNAEACLLLGRLYERGEGVRKDQSRATALYTKACQLGLDEGCLSASPSGEVLPPRM